MELLYILFGGLLAFLALKKGTLSSRAEDSKTKEKLDEIEKEALKNEVTIQLEENKREELKKEMTEKTNEVLSPKDIADFFNNRKS